MRQDETDVTGLRFDHRSTRVKVGGLGIPNELVPRSTSSTPSHLSKVSRGGWSWLPTRPVTCG